MKIEFRHYILCDGTCDGSSRPIANNNNKKYYRKKMKLFTSPAGRGACLLITFVVRVECGQSLRSEKPLGQFIFFSRSRLCLAAVGRRQHELSFRDETNRRKERKCL